MQHVQAGLGILSFPEGGVQAAQNLDTQRI